MQKFIIGNWKMSGNIALLSAYAKEFHHVSFENKIAGLCVPFVYLTEARQAFADTPLLLGAEDVSTYDQGAYTGQISAHMLKETGCEYVIIGHSERREFCYETNEDVAQKFLRVQAAGLTPILCVGETKEEREKNQTEWVLTRQLKTVLDAAGISAFNKAIVAYEPRWAIGTGVAATPDKVQPIHHWIKSFVGVPLPVIYGGSVKPDNAKSLFAMPDIDGVLVGGVSLNVTQFMQICEAC